MKERSSQGDKIKKELRELRKQHEELRGKNDALERSVRTLESQLNVQQHNAEANPEDLSNAKASFRIDLYARQGNGDYKGRIEHLLTKEKKLFDGVDKEAIAQFIASHLPRATRRTKDMAATKEIAGGIAHFDLLATDTEMPTYNIDHDRSFSVRVSLSQQALRGTKSAPVNCTALLQAKPLGKNLRLFIGEYAGPLPDSKMFTVDALARSLSPGLYRLIADVTLSPQREPTQPLHITEESNLINVY